MSASCVGKLLVNNSKACLEPGREFMDQEKFPGNLAPCFSSQISILLRSPGFASRFGSIILSEDEYFTSISAETPSTCWDSMSARLR